MRKRRVVLTAAALAAISSFTVACSSSGAGTSDSASGSYTAADQAYVKGQIAQYEEIPKFTAPGPAFDVSSARGKTIFNVPLSSTIPFVQTIDNEMAKLTKQLGIKYIQCPNQGQVSQYAQCLDQALGQNPDIIDLDEAPNPGSLQPQLAQAQAKGIKTIATHIYDVAGVPAPAAHLTAIVPAGFTTAARLDADWAIMKTDGKAHVLAVTADDIVPHTQMGQAVQDELAKHCGSGCAYKNLNVPLTQWPTKLQADVQAALLADPSINYVIPVVDGMTQYVVPGVIAAGRTGSVHVATFNGTPFAMKDLQDGNVIDMEVGEDLNWNAWADLDQIMRVLTGQKPVADEGTALRIFTPDNIDEAGKPPQVNVGYGNAFVSGYGKLWKGASVSQ